MFALCAFITCLCRIGSALLLIATERRCELGDWIASTSQICPLDDTTASTCTGPQRVLTVGPSIVRPWHVAAAAGCFAAGSVVDETAGGTTEGDGTGTAGAT